MTKINPTTASDEEVEREADRHARNERRWAWLIVAALAFDAVILWIYRHNAMEAILLIIPDLGIAAGVYGEIRSGRLASRWTGELSKRSKDAVAKANARAAEANQKAEEANLALAMYWRPRVLNDDEITRIADKLRPYAGVKYVGGVSFSDPEFIALLGYIEEALEDAGWIEVDCPKAKRIERVGKPYICDAVPVLRVKIELLTKTHSPEIDLLRDAGVALRDALNAEPKGLEARFSVTWEDPLPGEIATMCVMVGKKI